MLKLYTNSPANFFYYGPKMTADYCSYPVQVVVVDPEMEKDKEFKNKKGSMKFPFLETADGKVMCESAAISGYIARCAGQPAFLGVGAMEEAQVEEMVCYANSSLVPLVKKSASHHWGMQVDDVGRKVAEN